jgi:hypothetical protein
MTTEELAQIITNYKGLSDRHKSIDEVKSIAYCRFSDFLKDCQRHSDLSDSDDEESLWEHFNKVEDKVENDWSKVKLK